MKPNILATHFSSDVDEFTLEMRSAYAVATLRTLTRSLRYERTDAGMVEIEDRFRYETPQTFEVPLTTRGNWQSRGEGALDIWQEQERLHVRIESSGAYEIVAQRIEEEGIVFTRVAIRKCTPQISGFIKVRFSPAVRGRDIRDFRRGGRPSAC